MAKFPKRLVALNIKELGQEEPLLDLLNAFSILEQVFLFDFELLEKIPGQTAAYVRSLNPNIKLAARVSDRHRESPSQAISISCASIIWLDEFDSLWVNEEVVRQMKLSGKTIYAISPEIHGFSRTKTEARWLDFQKWGVDGICTDYPMDAREILGI